MTPHRQATSDGMRSRQGLTRVLLLPAAVALLGASAIGAWLFGTQQTPVALRLPREHSPEMEALAKAEPENPGTLIPGPGKPSEVTGSWPQFRGPNRTNIAPDTRGLARKWPSGGPPVLWTEPVGEGYAGPVVHRGHVYLIDYDQERKEDAIRCLSLDDGAEIWRYTYSVRVKRQHGMSRTVPAVTDDYVVTLGPKCHVTCLDATTGEKQWQKDLRKEHGTEVPPWYAGQCPLIEGDTAILAPGGDPLMMAVELSSGEIRWKTPNPGGWGMTHSSIMAIDAAGVRQYVYCTTKGVVGVAADDGRLLWTKPDWRIGLATVPSPVIVPPDRIFLSGGYKAGCTLVRIKSTGQELTTEEVFRLDHTVFDAPQHTPILYQGHIYGVTTLGHADAKSQLACLSLDGERVWASGSERPFGLGPYLLADGMILALQGDEGTLHAIEAVPSGYRELAKADVLDGHDCWGPMALAAGRLLVRDLTTLVCLDVSKGTP